MAFYIEHRGQPLATRAADAHVPGGASEPYVLAGSVSMEHAIAERPIARMSVRVPAGATFTVLDFDEVTVDYPARPYRAEARASAALVHYWPLDEAAVALAIDIEGSANLTFGGGPAGLEYRRFDHEAAAVPYGAAPEWEHDTGAGLTGTLGTVGEEWTIAGFVRLRSP